MAECGIGGVEVVATPVAELILDQPPDLVVGLHACGTASDDVIELVIHSGAARLALVPCCHPRRPDLLSRSDLPVQGECADRVTSATLDALRVLRLEAARFRVDTTALGAAAVTGRDLVILARQSGSRARAERAKEALARWGKGGAAERGRT